MKLKTDLFLKILSSILILSVQEIGCLKICNNTKENTFIFFLEKLPKSIAELENSKQDFLPKMQELEITTQVLTKYFIGIQNEEGAVILLNFRQLKDINHDDIKCFTDFTYHSVDEHDRGIIDVNFSNLPEAVKIIYENEYIDLQVSIQS